MRLKNSCCYTKRFGHSPSLVSGMIEPYKKLYAYAHTESARTKYKVNKGVL